jgi:HEAT repeat protein
VEALHGDGFVRQAATLALSKMGAEAVRPLMGALSHHSPAVRRAAALALARMGGQGRAAAKAIDDRLKAETEALVRRALEEAFLNVLKE